MAKVNALLSSWTSTRAGYIDTINTNANNAQKYADNARTFARNAQDNTITNNTGNKTGVLSQKLTYLINLLENTTYGLNAIKNQTNNLKSYNPRTIYGGSSVSSTTTIINQSGEGVVQKLNFYSSTNMGSGSSRVKEYWCPIITVDGVQITPNSPWTEWCIDDTWYNSCGLPLYGNSSYPNNKFILNTGNDRTNFNGEVIFFNKSIKVDIRIIQSCSVNYQYLVTLK